MHKVETNNKKKGLNHRASKERERERAADQFQKNKIFLLYFFNFLNVRKAQLCRS
jgi:hypothetical protein